MEWITAETTDMLTELNLILENHRPVWTSLTLTRGPGKDPEESTVRCRHDLSIEPCGRTGLRILINDRDAGIIRYEDDGGDDDGRPLMIYSYAYPELPGNTTLVGYQGADGRIEIEFDGTVDIRRIQELAEHKREMKSKKTRETLRSFGKEPPEQLSSELLKACGLSGDRKDSKFTWCPRCEWGVPVKDLTEEGVCSDCREAAEAGKRFREEYIDGKCRGNGLTIGNTEAVEHDFDCRLESLSADIVDLLHAVEELANHPVYNTVLSRSGKDRRNLRKRFMKMISELEKMAGRMIFPD